MRGRDPRDPCIKTAASTDGKTGISGQGGRRSTGPRSLSISDSEVLRFGAMGSTESLEIICCDTVDAKAELSPLLHRRAAYSAQRSQETYQHKMLHCKPPNLEKAAFDSTVHHTSPRQPLWGAASQSSAQLQRTSPGQPLGDRISSGQSQVSTASTLISGLPSARLLQAELDFCRGSSAHNTPPSSAPSTPCAHDAPAHASAFAGVELARTLGLKLRRDSEPCVLEVREREPLSIDLRPELRTDMVWPLPPALTGSSHAQIG